MVPFPTMISEIMKSWIETSEIVSLPRTVLLVSRFSQGFCYSKVNVKYKSFARMLEMYLKTISNNESRKDSVKILLNSKM